MATYVERLLVERARAWEAAKAILDGAAAEGRNLTGEEEASYARATASVDEIGARAKKLTEDETAARTSEEALRSLMAQTPRTADTPDPDSKDAELRSFFRGERRELVIPPSLEARALTKGTNSAGGFTVPTSFYGKLWLHLIETANLINAGATVLTTNGGENLQIPVTTSHGAAAAVAEGATIGGTDPVFAQRTMGAYKFGQLITISRELVEDEGVDIESYLAKIVGWNLGNLIGQKFVVGAGSTEPTGLFASSTLGITSGTAVAGVPTMDNLLDLFYSVTAPYRNQPAAGWLMKDATAGAIRKIKDTTNQYIWQPSVVAGQPDQLFSKPVHTDPYVAATGVNNKSIAFGDFSAYLIRLVNGVRFESSTEYAFASDQITFRALIRGDGLLVDQTGAVKHFVGAAT